jgi:hypothetical protein
MILFLSMTTLVDLFCIDKNKEYFIILFLQINLMVVCSVLLRSMLKPLQDIDFSVGRMQVDK